MSIWYKKSVCAKNAIRRFELCFMYISRSFSVRLFRVLITIPFLSGCAQVRDTFGLNHYQADEFMVDPNDPLIIPPDYRLPEPSSQSKAFSKKFNHPISPDITSYSKDTNTEKKAFESLSKGKVIISDIRTQLEQAAKSEKKEYKKDRYKRYQGSFSDTFKRNLSSISEDDA